MFYTILLCQTKVFSFPSEFNDLYHSALFCFCAESSKLNHSQLSFAFVQYPVISTKLLCLIKDCFSTEPSDFYHSADLNKSFSFSLGSSDLYHSALWDKSFSFSAGSIDLYHVALSDKTFFYGRFHLCIAFFFLFACSSFWLWDLCFAITFCLPAFDKLVEQHINLIQYSTSLLWNCFLTISTIDWIRKSVIHFFKYIKCAIRTESYNIVLHSFAFVFILLCWKIQLKQ